MSALLYLFRHGQAAPPGLMVGQCDIPLSGEGRDQFRHWRDALSDVPFAAAWSSPLLRAKQSAALLLEGNAGGLKSADTLEDLREISLGLWEGKLKDRVRQDYAEIWQARGKDMLHTAPPGGESFQALSLRVLPAFAALCEAAAGHAFSLAVAHQAVNRVILAQVSGLPLDRLGEVPQPPACLNILAIAPDRGVALVEQRFAPQ